MLELFEGDHNSAEWSPDGQELVLDIVEDGYRHLHVMPATGGTPRRLTDGEREWDNFPQWSDDGSEIVYMRQLYESGRGDIPVISAVSVADVTIRTVVGDSTNAFLQPQFLESEGGESVLYVIAEFDVPVDEVRIADLLADLESEGN